MAVDLIAGATRTLGTRAGSVRLILRRIAVRGGRALRATLLLACIAVPTQAQSAKPSIVVILTDDMEVALVEQMPNVRSMIVDRGATFERAYFTDPLCCPSRATMLTGRYTQNTGVASNDHALFHAAGLPDKTFAVWLKAAGYRTGYVGRYLNNYPVPLPASYVPPGWDDWFVIRLGGPGIYYDYHINENGRSVIYGRDAASYSTDVFRAKALRFIRSVGTSPFLLQLGVSAPHSPHTPAPRHAALFPTLTAPKPPSFNEADVSDKPAYVSRLSSFSAATIAGIDRSYRDRARSLQAVDEVVKAVVERLEAAGRLGDTYIVLAADNGVAVGQHRLRGKGVPYEGVARMMLHVRGPGIAPRTKVRHLVGNVDLAPTFAEWAGVEAPADLDGRSLAPLLRPGAPPVTEGRYAYPLTFTDAEGGSWRGLRTRTYTYVEHHTGEKELYDLNADPHQLDNRARTASANLLAKLAARTAALAACKADECRRLEDAPL